MPRSPNNQIWYNYSLQIDWFQKLHIPECSYSYGWVGMFKVKRHGNFLMMRCNLTKQPAHVRVLYHTDNTVLNNKNVENNNQAS